MKRLYYGKMEIDIKDYVTEIFIPMNSIHGKPSFKDFTKSMSKYSKDTLGDFQGYCPWLSKLKTLAMTKLDRNMPVFEKFKNLWKGKSGDLQTARKSVAYSVIRRDSNPEATWEILKELGDGAFGKVQLAKSRIDDKLAAAKIIELQAEESLDDFLTEIEILSASNHINIVKLLASYFWEGKLWILIEYCSAGALDNIMFDLNHGLTEAQIRHVCHELLQALSYLHMNHVIHRDLKAGNILLTQQGLVKLADFGVSAKNKNTLQKRDSFIGTPYWMAPEVMICETFKDQPYDYRADIWSLGITLIELGQMEPPFHDIPPMRVLIKIQKSDPPTLDRPAAWSKLFNRFLKRCLVKDPNQRATARELLQDPFLDGADERLPIIDLINEISGEVYEEEIPVVDDHEHEHEDSQSLQSGRETPGSQSTNNVAEETDDGVCEQPAAPSAPRKRQAPAPPPIMSASAESAAEMNFVQDAEQILSDLDADLDQLYDQFPATTVTTEEANVSISTALHQSPQRETAVTTSPMKITNGTAAVVRDITPPAATVEDNKLSRQTVVLSVNTEPDMGAAEDSEAQPSPNVSQLKGMFEQQTNAIATPLKRIERRNSSNVSDKARNFEPNNRISTGSNDSGSDGPASGRLSREDMEYFPSGNVLRKRQEIVQQQLEQMDAKRAAGVPEDAHGNVGKLAERFNQSVEEQSQSLKEAPPPSPGAGRQKRRSAPPSSAFQERQAAVNAMMLQREDRKRSSMEGKPPPVPPHRTPPGAAGDFPGGISTANGPIGINQRSQHIKEAMERLQERRKSDNSGAADSPPQQNPEMYFGGFRPQPSPKSSSVASGSLSHPTNAQTSDEVANNGSPMKGPPTYTHADDIQCSASVLANQHRYEYAATVREDSMDDFVPVKDVVMTAAPPPPRPAFAHHHQQQQQQRRPVAPPEPPVDYEDAAPSGSRFIAQQPTIAAPHPPNAVAKHQNGHVKREDVVSSSSSSSNLVVERSSDAMSKKREEAEAVVKPKSSSRPPPQPTRETVEKPTRKRTMTKRTRVFVVDGVKMETTTMLSMQAKDDHDIRRMELQELKRLQKAEARQYQELAIKAQLAREQQEKKFEQETQLLLRQYDADIETLVKQQRKQLEEAEKLQEEDMKVAAKRLRLDQERELKQFREQLKQEAKLLKQEVEVLPRSDRKDALKRRRDMLDAEHVQREHRFQIELERQCELTLKRVQDQHREKIALLERQFLQQKHQLLRAREAALWELEERQIHEKNQLGKQQLKDYYFLQRSQMLVRHQKEMDHMRAASLQSEEHLFKELQQAKRQLPKHLRSETKVRTMMFKESLRISGDDGVDVSKKLRQFEENEKQRIKTELGKQDQKHQKRLDLLRQQNESTLKELEHLQNEKRKMLLENETQKLKLYDQEYHGDVQVWKSQLKPRKQSLEEKFLEELREQEEFYRMNSGSLSSSASSNHISAGMISA